MSEPVWDPLAACSDDRSLLAEFRSRSRSGDLAVLGAVPILLVATFTWFDGAPDPLVLSTVEPNLLSFVSAHFVHGSMSHLLANLAAYGFVAPTGYVLAVLSGRGREYVVALVGFLLVLPPVLSGLIVHGFDRGVTFGFSGVTMALVGVLAIYLGSFVGLRTGRDDLRTIAPGLFFLGLAFIASRTIPVADYRLAMVGAATVTALVYLGTFLRGTAGLRPLASVVSLQDAQLAVVGTLAFVVGLVVGFPERPPAGTVVVNTYGHLLGYAFGFVVPYAAFQVLGLNEVTEGG